MKTQQITLVSLESGEMWPVYVTRRTPTTMAVHDIGALAEFEMERGGDDNWYEVNYAQAWRVM